MIQVTSTQEAAFNAAGEAMADLHPRFYCGRPDHKAGQFAAWCDHPSRRFATVWGYGDTLAEAVTDMFRELEKAKQEPKVLVSAVEAKSAALDIINEERDRAADRGATKVGLDTLADRIAALPVRE